MTQSPATLLHPMGSMGEAIGGDVHLAAPSGDVPSAFTVGKPLENAPLAEGSVLHLSLKGEYFDAIRDGTKTMEYRLCTPYWTKRLVGREYARIVLTKGYPARDDHQRRLTREWRGFTLETIQHPHFGPDPVAVFAIDVKESA